MKTTLLEGKEHLITNIFGRTGDPQLQQIQDSINLLHQNFARSQEVKVTPTTPEKANQLSQTFPPTDAKLKQIVSSAVSTQLAASSFNTKIDKVLSKC